MANRENEISNYSLSDANFSYASSNTSKDPPTSGSLRLERFLDRLNNIDTVPDARREPSEADDEFILDNLLKDLENTPRKISNSRKPLLSENSSDQPEKWPRRETADTFALQELLLHTTEHREFEKSPNFNEAEELRTPEESTNKLHSASAESIELNLNSIAASDRSIDSEIKNAMDKRQTLALISIPIDRDIDETEFPSFLQSTTSSSDASNQEITSPDAQINISEINEDNGSQNYETDISSNESEKRAQSDGSYSMSSLVEETNSGGRLEMLAAFENLDVSPVQGRISVMPMRSYPCTPESVSSRNTALSLEPINFTPLKSIKINKISSVPKSCLSSKKRRLEKAANTSMFSPKRRNVAFGPSSAAEFNNFSPSNRLTPLPSQTASALFSLDMRKKVVPKEDAVTQMNSSILDEWNSDESSEDYKPKPSPKNVRNRRTSILSRSLSTPYDPSPRHLDPMEGTSSEDYSADDHYLASRMLSKSINYSMDEDIDFKEEIRDKKFVVHPSFDPAEDSLVHPNDLSFHISVDTSIGSNAHCSANVQNLPPLQCYEDVLMEEVEVESESSKCNSSMHALLSEVDEFDQEVMDEMSPLELSDSSVSAIEHDHCDKNLAPLLALRDYTSEHESAEKNHGSSTTYDPTLPHLQNEELTMELEGRLSMLLRQWSNTTKVEKARLSMDISDIQEDENICNEVVPAPRVEETIKLEGRLSMLIPSFSSTRIRALDSQVRTYVCTLQKQKRQEERVANATDTESLQAELQRLQLRKQELQHQIDIKLKMKLEYEHHQSLLEECCCIKENAIEIEDQAIKLAMEYKLQLSMSIWTVLKLTTNHISVSFSVPTPLYRIFIVDFFMNSHNDVVLRSKISNERSVQHVPLNGATTQEVSRYLFRNAEIVRESISEVHRTTDIPLVLQKAGYIISKGLILVREIERLESKFFVSFILQGDTGVLTVEILDKKKSSRVSIQFQVSIIHVSMKACLKVDIICGTASLDEIWKICMKHGFSRTSEQQNSDKDSVSMSKAVYEVESYLNS